MDYLIIIFFIKDATAETSQLLLFTLPSRNNAAHGYAEHVAGYISLQQALALTLATVHDNQKEVKIDSIQLTAMHAVSTSAVQLGVADEPNLYKFEACQYCIAFESPVFDHANTR